MDPNITRKGLLALKDSKPVPITAHSHEIVVPCVYTETVKKMMKAKGIELPLSHAKLAELRKIAKATPGHYEPDSDDKPGGSSHARGTTNVHVNIKNVIPEARHRRRGRKVNRSKVILARATGLIPAPPSMHPGMVRNPNYNLIRPFVANTPIGFEPKPAPTREEIKKELEREDALEKRIKAVEHLAERVHEAELQRTHLFRHQLLRHEESDKESESDEESDKSSSAKSSKSGSSTSSGRTVESLDTPSQRDRDVVRKLEQSTRDLEWLEEHRGSTTSSQAESLRRTSMSAIEQFMRRGDQNKEAIERAFREINAKKGL
jgi:hypothetical protein